MAGDLSPLAGRVIQFNVWAADNGSPRLESLGPTLVSVHVEKQNLFSPVFTTNNYDARVHLPTIPGVKVVCVNAIDPDDIRGKNISLSGSRYSRPNERTELTYSIKKDSPNVSYRLDAHTGCLYVNNVELKKGKHRLVVSVSDGSFSTSADINISVDDPLEDSLKFSQNRYFTHVLENSTKQINLLIVRVEDLPLNHHVTYSILNPNQYLTIGSTSGVIQATGRPLDREIQDHFSLIVQVITFYNYVSISNTSCV